MALWEKISKSSPVFQNQIVSLYNQRDELYQFPIEWRHWFAAEIESAICGSNINSVEHGLDPKIFKSYDLIVTFFNQLIGKVQLKLNGNGGSEQCDFFTRHKLSNTLDHFREKSHTEPLSLFSFIRSKLQSEILLIKDYESTQLLSNDPLINEITKTKQFVTKTNEILQAIQSNGQKFSEYCNAKLKYEDILSDPEQLQEGIQQDPNYESICRSKIEVLKNTLDKYVQAQQFNFCQYLENTDRNLTLTAELRKNICDKLTVWKYAQQHAANGIKIETGATLDKLQEYCEHLAEIIWNQFTQVTQAERCLQNGVVPTLLDDKKFSYTVKRFETTLLQLLGNLMHDSFIVEEQPQQICQSSIKFKKCVIIRFLVGRKLNVHMSHPLVTTKIISTAQASQVSISTDFSSVTGITDILNGVKFLECHENGHMKTIFDNMELKKINRQKTTGSDKLSVEEEKYCLHFSFTATVGMLSIPVSTLSMPIVVKSHATNQGALSLATVIWDNMMAQPGRVPFVVEEIAEWKNIQQVLNGKFLETTGRGLSSKNLKFLTEKCFGTRGEGELSQPVKISFTDFCKTKLPERSFSFWGWCYGALKLMENEKVNLNKLWNIGLVTGFIAREEAESIISKCPSGTFLIRFSDSLPGFITITLRTELEIIPWSPYSVFKERNLAMIIKETKCLKYLYQETGLVDKDTAFKEFYDKVIPSHSGYVGVLPTPDIIQSNVSPMGFTPPLQNPISLLNQGGWECPNPCIELQDLYQIMDLDTFLQDTA